MADAEPENTARTSDPTAQANDAPQEQRNGARRKWLIRLGLLVLSCLGSARAQGLVEQPGFFHQPAEPLPEVYTSDTGASRPAHPGPLVA